MEEIADHDHVYRRLTPHHLRPDGTVNSYAFMLYGEPDPHLSVDLAKLTTPQEAASRGRRPGTGVGSFTAAVPRSVGLTVKHDPLPENVAHSLIEGATSKEQCRRLAEAVAIVIRPHTMPRR
ncbi:MAG: hypothetical protein ACRDI2_12160 [Chloroflexota bacterium]